MQSEGLVLWMRESIILQYRMRCGEMAQGFVACMCHRSPNGCTARGGRPVSAYFFSLDWDLQEAGIRKLGENWDLQEAGQIMYVMFDS